MKESLSIIKQPFGSIIGAVQKKNCIYDRMGCYVVASVTNQEVVMVVAIGPEGPLVFWRFPLQLAMAKCGRLAVE